MANGDEISIDTSEFDGLAEVLERLPLEVQDKLLKQALGAGAAVMMLGVMQTCPVRTDEKTAHSTALAPGKLKADIHAVAGKTGRRWFIGAGPGTAYVLRWLERGHLLVKGGHLKNKSHGGGKGKIVGHVPPHPVLRPAFDENVANAVRAAYIGLQNGITEYWAKTLKKVKRAA